MKNHVKLGILLIVLAGAACLLIMTRPPEGELAGTDAHEHEGEEAGHEGEGQAAGVKTPETVDFTSFKAQLPPAKGKRTRVRLDTGMGSVEVVLFDDITPRTVKNFLNLVDKGFYTNMIFHRVARGFYIQTGDPTGMGSGGTKIPWPGEIVPELIHNQPGVVAMVNSEANMSLGQFYITVRAEGSLDGRHSIFGQVVKGMDVVAAINGVLTDQKGRPISPVAFKGAEVLGQE